MSGLRLNWQLLSAERRERLFILARHDGVSPSEYLRRLVDSEYDRLSASVGNERQPEDSWTEGTPQRQPAAYDQDCGLPLSRGIKCRLPLGHPGSHF